MAVDKDGNEIKEEGSSEGDKGKGTEGDSTSQAGPTPSFDPKVITDAVQKGLKEYVEANPPVDPVPTDPIKPQTTETNPLAEAIAPHINPRMERAELIADGAADMVTFYTKHPESREYMDDLEKAFKDSVTQGTPYAREHLWNNYVGANFEKFALKRDEENASKLLKAKENEDLGGGTGGAGGSPKIAVDHTTTPEDVDKSLENVEF